MRAELPLEVSDVSGVPAGDANCDRLAVREAAGEIAINSVVDARSAAPLVAESDETFRSDVDRTMSLHPGGSFAAPEPL